MNEQSLLAIFGFTLVSCFMVLMLSFRSCEMEETANQARVACLEKHSADECAKVIK